jgi:hypothetical protein
MRIAFTTLMLLGVPGTLLACPVCFGQNDSPLASAMNLGILAMLIVTVGVLVAFASFFVYLIKRARLAASDWPEAANPDPSREGGRYVPGAHGGVA